MSFAIGLGGFMDGFAKGQQIRQGWENEERKKVADERAKVLSDRQDVEYNRALEQRTAVDQINKDARTTFDSQVAAGTEKPDNFDSWYTKHTLPKLKNTYLLNGDLENADRVQKWGDSEDAKTGARLFQGAITKAQTGDYAGAIDDAIKIGQTKGYINNGYQVLGQEPIVSRDGTPRGFRLSIRTPDGKEVKQDVQSSDLPKLIATFGNPEAAWESQNAARAAADKRTADLQDYEEKKKIDNQYGVGTDTKLRSDAIKSLEKEDENNFKEGIPTLHSLPREKQEERIKERMSLISGKNMPGVTVGPNSLPSGPGKKVLFNNVTGEVETPSASPAPASSKGSSRPAPDDLRQKDDDANSGPRKTTWFGDVVTGIASLPGRAAEGLQRERQKWGDTLEEGRRAREEGSSKAASGQEQALAQANAALEQGVPAERIGAALAEAGVPEWQWPKAIQEQLRNRQMAIGLNP